LGLGPLNDLVGGPKPLDPTRARFASLAIRFALSRMDMRAARREIDDCPLMDAQQTCDGP